ncbi:MAG: FAD-dependent oxidoreductase [Gemmatimonadetes bacterium]|nr:FAD-dependent oxidoreductase [Gemmatimonadota bacterium]
MRKFDDIVVGSGIGGMTLALLLAETGRSVLLVEKSRAIGGSMLRFYRDGATRSARRERWSGSSAWR